MRQWVSMGLLCLASAVYGDSLASSGFCSTLSLAEVEAALGGKVGKPTPLPAQPTSPGGCAYMAMAQAATLTVMLFEPEDPADFYKGLVDGTASANQFKVEPITGLGTRAAHMPSNFFVLLGKKVLSVNYGGSSRAKIEPLVRKLAAKL